MKISNFKKFIFAALSAALFFIACEKEDSDDDNFDIISLYADGSASSRTTKLTFTVNNNKFILTADDIKINAVFSVIKDELSREGTTYELFITPGATGTIKVGLDPYRGFTGWNARTATVYADNYFTGNSELTITGLSYNLLDGELDIPEEINGRSVTAIGGSAFMGRKLISVYIPDSVRTIGESAFAYNQLPEIIIPDRVFYIGSNAFAYNQLSKVTMLESPANPEKVIYIGNGAFAYNQLSEVTIPKSITSIANSTFAYNKLTKIDIPEKVYYIGTDAFFDNRLSEVTIPKNVIYIGNGAFAYNQLSEIIIPEKVSSVSGFNNNKLTKVEFVFEIVTEVVDGVDTEVKKYKVTTIGSNAFSYNKLTKIDIPESVTIIGNNAFVYNQLKNITIPNGVITIGSYAFSNNLLESVTISESVADIGQRAFANNKLSEIKIPDNIKNIGIQAFMDNPLISITIGEDVSLGSSAFGNNFEYTYNDKDNKRAKGTYIWDIDSKKWIKKEDGDGGDGDGDE